MTNLEVSHEATFRGNEVLLRDALPEIYRKNAFRVIGLPVEATGREVARQVQEVKIQERLGGAPLKSAGALALDPPPDWHAVQEALRRLRDPERRLVDELFWFWPRRLGDGRQDPSLTRLAQGEVEAAKAMWIGQENSGSDGHVAAHNLAVLAHASALDLEHASRSGPLSDEKAALRDTLWRQALARWEDLLCRDDFWDRLAVRVQDLKDPRLPVEAAGALRRSLPLALLLINARLAVRSGEAGQFDEAERQVHLVQGSRVDEPLKHEALHMASAGFRDRLRLLCKSAKEEADAKPERADGPPRRLLEQSRPLLAALDVLLPEDDEVRRGAHDQVALQVLSCQIAYGNRTDDWETSLALLEGATELAVGATARGRLEENVRIVQSNLEHDREYGTCFFCGESPPADEAAVEIKLHRDVIRVPVSGGVQVRWRSLTSKVPRCPGCKSAHARIALATGVGGLLGGLILGGSVALVTRDAGCASLILAVFLFFVGVELGKLVGKRMAKKDLRLEDAAAQFPAVQRLRDDGWTIGEKPPGTQ